ncbi:MAG: hypothetical protein ACU0DW_04940 [Shimia sp.]
MSFLRPTAVATLARWRDAILGAALAVLGLYWISGTGLLPAIGAVALLAGAALGWMGLRRALRPRPADAPGVVEVSERQITYLHPEQGGAILSIDALQRVEVARHPKGHRWHLTDRSGAQLAIPGGARGADQLYDALLALPGMDPGAASTAARPGRPDRTLLWQKDRRGLH